MEKAENRGKTECPYFRIIKYIIVLKIFRCGQACKVAAFLNEFVPCGDWLHMDTYGVMRTDGVDYPYLRAGMSGRPTRTLVEFLSQLVCHRE